MIPFDTTNTYYVDVSGFIKFNSLPYAVVRKSLINDDTFMVVSRHATYTAAEAEAVELARGYKDEGRVFYVIEVRAAYRADQNNIPVTEYNYGDGDTYTHVED